MSRSPTAKLKARQRLASQQADKERRRLRREAKAVPEWGAVPRIKSPAQRLAMMEPEPGEPGDMAAIAASMGITLR